jgi:NTP pyrophosphatase (non-canonical NTP hydrolase)
VKLDDYQARAAVTNELPSTGPKNAVAAMLGLASETGSILNVYKQYLRRNIDLSANTDFLREELGDLLWYLSTVASAFGLSLDDIAQTNLARTNDYYLDPTKRVDEIRALPALDAAFEPHEQFPRRMVFQFVETRDDDGEPVVEIILLEAKPNVFPEGGQQVGSAPFRGFTIGEAFGASLTDNSSRGDGYRYHDAIHLGFCGVLGWSPLARKQLGLKRRSDRAVDDNEDGARALFAEEGIAAMLAMLSRGRLDFQTESSVDMETINVARAVVNDLECSSLPAWLWRRAIAQSFRALRDLERNRGGFLVLDLDERTIGVTARREGGATSGARVDVHRLVAAIDRLHEAKDATYGDAWKKRGETLGIMTNVLRKSDRLAQLEAGGPTTADESHLDTFVDLFVYLVKYRLYLADADAAIDTSLFPEQADGRGVRSDGPRYVSQLLARYVDAPDTRTPDERETTVATLLERLEQHAGILSGNDTLGTSESASSVSGMAGLAWWALLDYGQSHPDELSDFVKAKHAS